MTQLPEVNTTTIPGKVKDLSIWTQAGKEADKLAIVLPGFLDSGDYPHLRDLSSRLSQVGYVCVRFDPPGTWTNGGDIANYNLTNYVQTVVDVHDWAKQQFGTKKCVLVGHSFGGVVAIVAATKLKDIAAVVAIMSPAHLTAAVRWPPSEARKSIRQEPNNLAKGRHFIVPYSFARDVDDYNIPVEAESLKCPALFIAGELDTTVLPTEVKELTERAQQGQYLLIKGIQHGYWKIPEQVKTVHTVVMDYLREKRLA